MSDLLEPGTQAPDFGGTNQDGLPIRLGDFRGKAVVLYFYPEDDTLGCTRESCAFRDDSDAFREKGAVVLGISVQGESSHRAFRDKYHLPFDLVADPDKRITRAYNALGPLGLAKRVTYIIGPDGKVKNVFPKANTSTFAADVLALL